MLKEPILPSKLDEGIQKTKRQIKSLLDSSYFLNQKRRYTESISLSILGREELAKLRVFRIHKKLNLPITNKEWRIVTAHRIKLTLPYYLAFASLRTKSVREIFELNQIYKDFGVKEQITLPELVEDINKDYLNFLESLDYLKQSCLYLDWVDKDWFSVIENFTNSEKKAISEVLFTELNLDYHHALLAMNYPDLKGKQLLQTGISKKIKSIRKEMNSAEFKIMRKTVKKLITKYFLPRVLEDQKREMEHKKKKKPTS